MHIEGKKMYEVRAPEKRETQEIFSASFLSWLHERGCGGIRLVPSMGELETPLWLAENNTPLDYFSGGWAFAVKNRQDISHYFLFEFSNAKQLSDSDLRQIAQYLDASKLFCDFEPVAQSFPLTLLGSSAVIDKCIHDLRNKLNSLVMNVAVLCSRLPDQANIMRFAHQIDQDGQACAEHLKRLSEALLVTPGEKSESHDLLQRT